MEEQPTSFLKPDTNRILSIDLFRGIAIILMVAVNFLAAVNSIPVWLKHAPDIGYTIADVVAPLFIFAIGLTYKTSFEKRIQKYEAFKTYMHFIKRYLVLVGIGAILTAGEAVFMDTPSNWGVLQAIGIAGLITLIFIRFNIYIRMISGFILLIIYQIVLNKFLLATVLNSSHGGLFGSISWAAMMIISTVAAEIFYRKKWQYLVFVITLTILSVVSIFLVPVSKNRVSISYVLVSITISALFFWFLDFISNHIKNHRGPVIWWGQNPIVLYMLHLILLGFFALVPVYSWYEGAPLWLTALQLCFLLTGITVVAWFLYKKKILIVL